MYSSQNDFDKLFANNTDPWGFKSRWYEARKRALTLAALPAERFGSAFEPGCANGELTAALAGRCDQLLASDGSEVALEIARHRLRACGNVRLLKAWLPEQWPDEEFDLIVISELGYFLKRASLVELAERARMSLRSGGTVLACHWRKPIASCELTGDAVHEVLHQGLGLHRLGAYIDEDMRLEAWCADARSVGRRENLT